MAGGQTVYVLTMDVGVPGQIQDENLDSKVLSFPAGEPIGFGLLCEIDANEKLHPVQGASAAVASGTLAGVSVFDVAREQQLAAAGGSAGSGYYNSGDMVPVLRKGRIYAQWDGSTGGTAQAPFVVPNVNHPSGPTDPQGLRGVFTGGATSVAVGSEAGAVPKEILFVRNVASSTPQRGSNVNKQYTYVCLLEVNLPGA